MTEQNPGVGQPEGGRNTGSGEGVPGTTGPSETVEPTSGGDDHDTGTRAADAPMDTSDADAPQATEGIPSQVDAPGPSGATDANPPGGSVANQGGRTPDSGSSTGR